MLPPPTTGGRTRRQERDEAWSPPHPGGANATPQLGAEIVAPKRRIVGAHVTLWMAPGSPPGYSGAPYLASARSLAGGPRVPVQSSGTTYVIGPWWAVYRTSDPSVRRCPTTVRRGAFGSTTGGFQQRPLPDSGRFEVEDGSTLAHDDNARRCTGVRGDFRGRWWLEAWMQPDGQLEQFGNLTAGT